MSVFKPLSASLLLVAACLPVSAALAAQPAVAQTAESRPVKPEPRYESYLLTVYLTITSHGKKTDERSYSVSLTYLSDDEGRMRSEGRNPSVRDDDNMPRSIAGDNGLKQYQWENLGTDIDVNPTQKRGSLLAFSLTLNQTFFVGADIGGGLPPVKHEARYNVSAAVPVNKTVTVFSSSNEAAEQKVEIKVLARPLVYE